MGNCMDEGSDGKVELGGHSLVGCYRIDRFIPSAMEYATRAADMGGLKKPKEYNLFWDRIFHGEMNRLTIKAGERYKIC